MPIDEEVKSRQILVNYFQAGETPCEEHFRDLIKSFIHHEEDGVTICKYDTAVEECDVEEVSDIKLEAKTSDYLAYTKLHLDGLNSTASIVTGASGEMGTGETWDNGLFGTGIDLDSNEPGGLIWMKAGKVLIEKDLCVNDNVDIGKNLLVGIDAEITDNLTVGLDATIGDNLTVGIDATIGENLSVGIDATIGENLTVGIDATINENLSVGIDATVGQNLSVGNDGSIGNDLDVGNDANVANVLTIGPGATGVEDHLIVHGNACINGNLKVTGDMIVENTTEYNKVVLGDEKADEVQIQGFVNAGDLQKVICFDSPVSFRGGINDGGAGKNDFGEIFLGEGTSDDNKFLRIRNNILEIGHANGNCHDENYVHAPQLSLDSLGTLYITNNDISTLPALPGSAMYSLFIDGNTRVNGDIYLEDGTGNSAGVLVGVNDADLCDTSMVEWVPTSGLVCDYLNSNHAALNGSCEESFQTLKLRVCSVMEVRGGLVEMTNEDITDPHINEITMTYKGLDYEGSKCITADNGLLLFGTKSSGGGGCDKHVIINEDGDMFIKPPDITSLPTGYSLYVEGDTNIHGKLDVLDLCIGGLPFGDLLVSGKNTVPVNSVALASGSILPEYSEVPIDDLSTIKVVLSESIEVKDDQERYAYVLLEIDAISRTELNSFFIYSFAMSQVSSLGDQYLILRTELPTSRINPDEVEMTVPIEVIDELKSSLFKRTRMHIILEGKQFGVGTGAADYDDFNFSLWITPQQVAGEDIGSGGNQVNDMYLPAGIAMLGSDRIIVTDQGLRKVQAYKVADGSASTIYGVNPEQDGEIHNVVKFQPEPLGEPPFVGAIQQLGNNFAYLDSNDPRVVFIDSEGQYLAGYDIEGRGLGFTQSTSEFAMTATKRAAVVDSNQQVINIYDDAGDFLSSFTVNGTVSGYWQVKVLDAFGGFLVYYPSPSNSTTTVIEKFDLDGSYQGTEFVDDSLGLMAASATTAFLLRTDGVYEYSASGLESLLFTRPESESYFTEMAANNNFVFVSGGPSSDKLYRGDLNAVGSGPSTLGQVSFIGFSTPPTSINAMAVDDNDQVVFASNPNYQTQGMVNSLYKIDQDGLRLPFLENYFQGNDVVLRPSDVAVNGAGEVHVLDGELKTVKVFDDSGAFVRSIGQQGYGAGEFDNAQFIEIDSNNDIYVLDTAQRQISRFKQDGTFDYMWSGNHVNTPFSDPLSMAIDLGNDRLYVIDRKTLKVHTLGLTSPPDDITSWSGTPWDGPLDLSNGMTIGIHGHVFIHDGLHRNIQVYRNDGTHITSIGGRQQGSRNVTVSVGMAYDPGSMKLYVTNPEAATVHTFDVSNIPT